MEDLYCVVLYNPDGTVHAVLESQGRSSVPRSTAYRWLSEVRDNPLFAKYTAKVEAAK